VQALSYFASKDNCKEQIVTVLQHVEDYHLLPPLMVIQTLAESPCSTLSDIKVCECVCTREYVHACVCTYMPVRWVHVGGEGVGVGWLWFFC